MKKFILWAFLSILIINVMTLLGVLYISGLDGLSILFLGLGLVLIGCLYKTWSAWYFLED